MIIKNTFIYTSDHNFHKGDINIFKDRIVKDPQKEDSMIIDGTGLYAIPGLVDIHFHGAVGHDFCDGDPEGLSEIAKYEVSHGITAICPATMTYSEEILTKVVETYAAHKDDLGADLVGINMEGPFISPDKLGAQNPKYVKGGNIDMFTRLNKKSGGMIKLVDVAPEVPGNLDFIRKVSQVTRVSLAHTCADYETALAAFKAGAGHMTHLYNAMPGINHREPGPIIAALESGADVELIADGVHIHPAMVKFTFRTFGADKVILISDSMMATGLEDGDYSLGGQAVSVKGNRAVLTKNPGTVAGSVTNLYDCMKEAVLNMGIPLKDAVRAASENPARAIGRDKDYGSLSCGAYANVVLADKDLNIVNIIHRGMML